MRNTLKEKLKKDEEKEREDEEPFVASQVALLLGL